MNVFITGGAGLLGSELLRSKPKGVTVLATYHENVLLPDGVDCTFVNTDIRDENILLEHVLPFKPDAIIHTAAIGSPDICEKDPKRAHDVNVVGTRNIVSLAGQTGSHVFYTSTNQVFSGIQPPYSEKSTPDPVNVYGRTKVQSEKDIRESNVAATIIRLMTMYGWNNPKGQKNTATWVIEMLSKGIPIKVVDDIYNNFLWVGQASSIIWELVTKKSTIPLIHIAGAETENRYVFAKKVAEQFSLDTSLITPVKKSYFKDEAPRPLNTVYDISLLKSLTSCHIFSLDEGLEDMKKTRKDVTWKALR